MPGPVSLKCQATGFVGSWPSWALEETGCRQPGCAPCSRRSRRLPDATLGALNPLSVRQTPMVEADIIVAQAFADLATVSILQHRTATEARRLNEQLSAA